MTATLDSSWLDVHHEALRESRVAFIKSLAISPNSLALDVGCGSGCFARELQTVHDLSHMTCVDRSAELVAVAREKFTLEESRRMQWLVEDIETYSAAPKSFDLILCMNTLEYVLNPTQIIVKLLRLLRPRGMLVIKEEDAFRDILLSWPADFELAIQTAWNEILKESRGAGWNPEAGRELLRIARSAAGSMTVTPRLLVNSISDAQNPAVRKYVKGAFERYLEGYRRHLSRANFSALCRYLGIGVNSSGAGTLFQDKGFWLTNVEYVAIVST